MPVIAQPDDSSDDAIIASFQQVRNGVCPRCKGALIGDPEEKRATVVRNPHTGQLERRVTAIGAGCAKCGAMWSCGQDGEGPWVDEKLPLGQKTSAPLPEV